MQETPKSLILLRFTTEPRTGRFITRDSYRGERENADTWHLYAYCAYTPINYVDSLYLQTCWYLLQKG
ncbi:hypothetical protein DW099_03225 [Emergencia timonensis]|uniref:RHS repeat-associated core domain-containing protein n=1 Tax=Emergencia timonensis TaxID=1776384 RepID=A0A415E7B6_9FIRM|nr:hypothetical protein DW099_03225 [Emergencia timonensis]